MALNKSLALATIVAIFAPGASLVGQQKTPQPPPLGAKNGKAEIVGVVIDSLNGRFLSGADVIIEGSKANLITDSAGRFAIDGLPPGTYQVGVFHPLLDTLGISLATKPFHVGPDSTSAVVLSVPSAATIIRGTCKVRPRATGTSAVIGHVNEPETLQPVVGAEVSIAWTDIEASKQAGVRRTPHVLRDSTDATGSFKLCGLPSSLQATLQARKGGSVTAEIPINLGDQENTLSARTLLLSHADSGAKTGSASVSGRVILDGAPSNAGSRVEVVGTDIVALTNDRGDFTIRNLPSGSQVLLARHLGFGAEWVPVDLSSRQAKQVSIKLPKFVAMMDPVLVTARRTAGLDKIGFNQRKKAGFGRFLGPEEIQAMHPNYVTDILRNVPGLKVNYGPDGETVTSSRGATSIMGGNCTQYYLDDMPWQSMTPGDINSFVNGSEIVGVEVYQGGNTPPRYSQGMRNCTTIVLWTKFKVRD